jgi:hypothetical protein
MSSTYRCCCHRRSPPPLFATSPNPSGKDAATTTQGDSIPPTIAVQRRRCPRRTSRWASSTLIIVLLIVIIVNVGATLPPSDGVHGVCHGATAGRGVSDNANFGRSGSLWMPPHSLRLPFCRPAGAAIPGEEEDDARLVEATRPSSWRHRPDESMSNPLRSLHLYLRRCRRRPLPPQLHRRCRSGTTRRFRRRDHPPPLRAPPPRIPSLTVTLVDC